MLSPVEQRQRDLRRGGGCIQERQGTIGFCGGKGRPGQTRKQNSPGKCGGSQLWFLLFSFFKPYIKHLLCSRHRTKHGEIRSRVGDGAYRDVHILSVLEIVTEELGHREA